MQLGPSRLPPSPLRALALGAIALAISTLGLAAPLRAQSPFSPAITVNDAIISYYELEQRANFLTLLRAPGSAPEEARKALIEEVLKEQAIRGAGIEVTEEAIAEGITEFAARANLSGDEFVQALSQAGVDPATFRDFVTVGVGWREFVRARFLPRARPTDAEIDRALGADGSSGGVRVLLSEIIMPLTPENIDQVTALAEEIAQVTSEGEFSSLAGQYSATATRSNGGRMAWMPLTNLPPQLRPLILSLAPGEVTAPIPLPDAVALFQLRGIEETTAPDPVYSAIDYAAYYIPGGRSEAALTQAARIAAQVDTCDDLYGVAQGQPAEVLERGSLAPSEIPQDIAVELAKLDDGEVSTALTRANGQTLVFLMLCGRTAEINQDASRQDVANALLQERLNAFADSYLSQLQADALIIDNTALE
ncbi:MAG: peptidylprolyl isomerase [Rhodobacteraceae bacterium]|nr:MAG: peptidylprolyl isomerase [Paracoccaceae bacterium]